MPAASRTATSIDLHGCRENEAIREVTQFLERIRTTVAKSSKGRRHGSILYVTIITGAGSHSHGGPVLRSAVQRLLEKRGMQFKLERGGGAFQVDALSGHDLYDAGPALDSKVVVSEQDEFHQLAMLRRRGNAGANFAHATMAQCTGSSRSRTHRKLPVKKSSHSRSNPNMQVPNSFGRGGSTGSDPLPRQVATEEKDMRAAKEMSVRETQKRRKEKHRMSKQFEHEYQRAVSESQLAQVNSKMREEEFREEEESQLKLAYKQSRMEEQHRQEMSEKEYENELLLAMEQSTKEANDTSHIPEEEEDLFQKALAESMAYAEEVKKTRNAGLRGNELANVGENNILHASEDELIRRALAESMASANSERSNYSEDDSLAKTKASSHETGTTKASEEESEDELIRQAIAESMALAEAEKANNLNDDSLEKALAASQETSNAVTSEEDELIRQAMAESRALAEAEKSNNSNDDMLEKALAESLMEEEKRKARNHKSEGMVAPDGFDLLEEVIRLSLKQKEEEAKAEEEAMREAVEKSKQSR